MVRLNQRRVDAFEPREAAYNVRDDDLKGFGVKVLPSGGKRYFVHSQRNGRRVWKIVGKDIAEEEARARAKAVLARGGTPAAAAFETVAEEAFERYGRNWKPRTLEVNRGYYRNQILPWFGGRRIAEITRQDVQRWFASLHATPAAANRSAPILSVIMRQAEAYGYRPEDSNPCKGIRRYRQEGRERFLTVAEIRRLGSVLAGREPDRRVAVVRLLLLTGCRKSEILTLRWIDYREGKLFLADGKTGPRTVWLSSAARRILDGLDRADRWIFPSASGPLGKNSLDRFWQAARAEAELSDVRLHDLRHTYASVALRHGETVLTIGRLLGHDKPETTLKYAHAADETVRGRGGRRGAGGLRHESSADRRRRAQAPRARIHGLGLANVGPRGSGPAVRTSQLHIPSQRPEGVARSGGAEEHRRGAPRMRRPCGGEAEGSHVRGVRRGSVEGGLLGALQEDDALGEVR